MFRTAFAVIALLTLSQTTLAQGDRATVKKLIEYGTHHNNIMELLTHLTTKIGPRVTGTSECQIACDWAVHKFKQFGMMNARLERWGEFPVLFSRGGVQRGRMLEPAERKLTFSSNAWTPGTNGPLRGRVVAQPLSEVDFQAVKARLKGAWVLMKEVVSMRNDRDLKMSLIDQHVTDSGIAGRVYISRDPDLVWAHGNPQVKWESLPTVPSVMITGKEGRIVRLHMEAGKQVELEFNIGNHFIGEPVPLYNVIADIPGTEKPDEFVIISAHYDSWDAPGSQGAQDNGTGSMMVLEAARLLVMAGAKPKRTIRFILWTGEEQGLLGSFQYVKDHAKELSKISALFVDDGGTNYQGGYAVLPSQKAMMEEAMAPMHRAFPELPLKLDTVEKIEGGGSDHVPFLLAAVPAFGTYESGRADYRWVWHTQNDRLETVIPEYMIQSSTNAAVVAFNLACAKALLPREGMGGK